MAASHKGYIPKNYRSRFIAASKAKIDAQKIVKSLGFRNLGLKDTFVKQKQIGYLISVLSTLVGMARMPKNGIFFGQYPLVLLPRQVRRAKARGCRVIILVHDIEALRFNTLTDLSVLNEADVVIAHTEAMKKWLLENGITSKIEVLQIFDYLTRLKPKNPKLGEMYRVAFAGNLLKSSFFDKVYPQNYELMLFGEGLSVHLPRKNMGYGGCFPPEKLLSHLDSHFGLVWDGYSANSCTGETGEYLRYICPHKFSLYMAAGLPVFVWKESAMALFVEKYGVGFTIGSLSEIDYILDNLTIAEYAEMRARVLEISKRVRRGDFLSQIVERNL